MSKHTEGPWTVEPTLRPDLDDDPMGEYRVQPAADLLTQRYFAVDSDEYVAEVGTPMLDAIHAENRANARLVAAAPDLLEAAQEVIVDLELHVSTHGPGPDRRMDALKAAIAKAREE